MFTEHLLLFAQSLESCAFLAVALLISLCVSRLCKYLSTLYVDDFLLSDRAVFNERNICLADELFYALGLVQECGYKVSFSTRLFRLVSSDFDDAVVEHVLSVSLCSIHAQLPNLRRDGLSYNFEFYDLRFETF